MENVLEKRWVKVLWAVFAVGGIGSLFSNETSINSVSSTKKEVIQEKKKVEVCDGTSVTHDCSFDGV